MLTHLDLFSGVGGFSFAAKQVGGILSTQFVEIDPDAQAVLRSRFPGIPIHADISDYSPIPYEFDFVSCGFPCTGTSSGGKRNGLLHPESSLWWEALRVIIQGNPRFVVIENPEGLIDRGLREVLASLRMAGYSWDDPQLVPAFAIGSPQIRKRLFVVSYSNSVMARWTQPPTSWGEQINNMVEAERAAREWLSFERRDSGVVARFPSGMDTSFGVKPRTGKHLRRRKLLGRSVIPEQAAIALRRVLYLDSLAPS